MIVDWFCYFYPDAVHSGKAIEVLANIQRLGIELVFSVGSTPDIEEIKAIFFARRSSQDFEDFCQSLLVSPSLLVHLRASPSQIDNAFIKLSANQAQCIYMPTDRSEHRALLLLLDKNYKKPDLKIVVKELRAAVAGLENDDDKHFATVAVREGRKLFTYHTAMRVSGFTDEQAFTLVEALHQWLLTEHSSDADENNSKSEDEQE